jgi:hypothetical protein
MTKKKALILTVYKILFKSVTVGDVVARGGMCKKQVGDSGF